ncbi:phosphodiester glycosidase family protein [Metabacillus sp. GX 13764]|uniref:phosphodiester glycosidase family protein n=1 Tax=Metabacillus kandeliae TaxID=2900151 RepID=UPI001E5C2837|nr:phosphodiester glycosidase family protein [Metabacillus kandeliae]MCD7034519.1 phosphodiester glycosidase family protein [Metabacillus kandeliae]
MRKQLVPVLLIFGMLLQPAAGTFAAETPAEKKTVLSSNQLAGGITHEEQRIENFGGKINYTQRLNVLTADLSNPDVSVTSGKALDKVAAMETIGDQAGRERFKGKNVVGAINGDMYNMQTGMNVAAQIQDGNLLVSHTGPSGVNAQPEFGIDANRKPFIDNLSIEGKLTYDGADKPIELLNRNEGAGEKLGIYTPNLNQKGEMSFYDLKNTFVKNGAMAVITGIDDPEHIKPGKAYTGTITKIYPSISNIAIPKNGVVLAGFGTKAEWMRTALKENTPFTFEYNVYKGTSHTLKNDVVDAVGGYDWLVKDGKAKTQSEFRNANDAHVTAPNGRTSIGITADNKVIAMTVDKPSTLFSDSVGLTLPEVAKEYESYGVVSALSLDGGGSTEMVIQPEGTDQLVSANHPSDNSSRVVTNSILFSSSAEKSPEVGKVLLKNDLTIFKGSSYKFSAKATDANGNTTDLDNRSVNWSTTLGTISKDGEFTAPSEAGEGKITAEIDGAKGESSIHVIDSVSDFQFADSSPIILQKGEEKELKVNAQKDGKDIILNGSSVKWEIPAEAGTIEDGKLKISDSAKDGSTYTIKATLGDITKELTLLVGLKEQKIDDFETYPAEGYEVNGFVGGNFELSTEQKKSGSRSIKVNYDTKNWTRQYNGTINLKPHWFKSTATPPAWSDTLADSMFKTYTTEIRPKKFGVWIYGDGKAPWARLIFKSNGANKTLDLAGSVNWIGWKYLEVDIPTEWAMPITFNYLYFVETNKTKPDYSGSVYIDDMRFIYTNETEDFSGPEFSEISPESNTIYSDKLDFAATVKDEGSGVDPSTIKVTFNNKEQDFNYDKDTGKITGTVTGLAEGTYPLSITASDKKGNQALPPVSKNIKVDLTEDTEAPTVTNVTPTPTAAEQTAVPRITFRARDPKSGLEQKDIAVSIDGKQAETYYDAATGWAYAVPAEKLADGKHSYTIDAKDRAGNSIETIKTDFTIKSLPAPKDPNNFKISMIPDTHGMIYQKPIFERAEQEDSDLVLHTGDLVDTSSEAEWNQAKDDLKIFENKPFLMVPGNHESFKGDLDYFTSIIGSPTFSTEYGNANIIGLNTAYGQSISASDSTQFHYLENVLEQNKKKNVIVAVHVLTKDDFGTAHEMNPADAKKFEDILGSYKKSHPEVNIQVFFGHLHTLQQWEKDGVMYTVGGNAASKGYVTKDEGNILGSGILTVGDKMSYQFNPLLSSVSIVDRALNSNREMKMAKGATRNMQLYGDFHEYTGHYIVNISQFPPVNIGWTSDHPEIATVDSTGKLTAKAEGTVTLTAVSGGKSNSVKVHVVDPAAITPIKLEGALSKSSVLIGEKTALSFTAVDQFGNIFAIDPKEVQLSYNPENSLELLKDGMLQTKKTGNIQINYKYGKITGTLDLEVKSPGVTPPDQGGGHGDDDNNGGGDDDNGGGTTPPKQEDEIKVSPSPIGRAIIKKPVSIFKLNDKGEKTPWRTAQPGEVLRVYGQNEEMASVGGDYYIMLEKGKTAMYQGRILIKENATLYSPDGKPYRTLHRGEAIKVYHFLADSYDTGGGFTVKFSRASAYYEGMVKMLKDTPMYKDGKAVQSLMQGKDYRVYSTEGNKLMVGGGYYVMNEKRNVVYSKN